MTKARY